MERILLEVADQTAKAWRNSSPQLRDQIQKSIDKVLASALETSKEANFELLLKDARETAAKNGLTEEILNQLLNDED